MMRRALRSAIAAASIAMLAFACDVRDRVMTPSVEFTTVPEAAAGGSDKRARVAGRVTGAGPGIGSCSTPGAASGGCSRSPSQPFTTVAADATWENTIHLGTEYAALLVDAGFRPPATIEGAAAAGRLGARRRHRQGDGQIPPRARRRSSPSAATSGRSGRSRAIAAARTTTTPANAWTDAEGLLHLRLAQRDGRWTSAEVILTRALGYGTYAFTVRDTSTLDPAAAFGMLTWDDSGPDQNHRETGHRDQPVGRSAASPTRSTSCSRTTCRRTSRASRRRPARSRTRSGGSRVAPRSARSGAGTRWLATSGRAARVHVGRADARHRTGAHEPLLLPLRAAACRRRTSRSSLSGSSTCRSAAGSSAARAGRWCSPASSRWPPAPRRSTPSDRISQYLRDRWGSESGFPGGPVYAIAQTSDGYLWIGAEKGLVRFDGLTFRLFDPGFGRAAPGRRCSASPRPPDGSLWARLRGAASSAITPACFRQPARGRRPAGVGRLGDGSAAARTRCCSRRSATAPWRIAAAASTPIATTRMLPSSSFVISMAEAPNGDVWLGSRDAGLLRVRGRRSPATPTACPT